MLNDQKLGNYLGVSNRTNQFQIQVVKERGDPFLRMTREQEGRKTSRSQEIDVNSFHEETVSSERTERPVVETSVIQTRSSEDRVRIPTLKRHMKERGDSLLKQTQKMCQIVVKHVLVMKAKHSTLEIKHFVKERRDPLLIMTIHFVQQTMLNEADMDFRIPGLPHSVVKHAQSTSVRELIQKIENHPDRHALQQDLRQNQAYNPFGPESKKMIQEVGIIELFQLHETDPKTQRTACLSYWNVGIVYCTCGHFLQKETVANRGFIEYKLDFLSIPEYVIKKGRPHGHRYGKKPGDKEYYLANQL